MLGLLVAEVREEDPQGVHIALHGRICRHMHLH